MNLNDLMSSTFDMEAGKCLAVQTALAEVTGEMFPMEALGPYVTARVDGEETLIAETNGNTTSKLYGEIEQAAGAKLHLREKPGQRLKVLCFDRETALAIVGEELWKAQTELQAAAAAEGWTLGRAAQGTGKLEVTSLSGEAQTEQAHGAAIASGAGAHHKAAREILATYAARPC